MKELERRLALGSVTAVGISAMIGSGIFVLPGIGAAVTGPSIWLAYAVAGLGVLPAALSTSELTSAMPISGGTYVFLERAFGPLAGTVAGLGIWASLLLKSCFALVGLSAYLQAIVAVPGKLAALCLLGATLLLNIRGVHGVAVVQMALTALCLVSLAFLSAVGATAVQPERFEPFFQDGFLGFVGAVAVVTVSFVGVTKVSAIAGEVQRPERNLPLGIILSLSVVTIAYTGVAVVLVGCIPMDVLQSDLRPVYTLGATLGGTWWGIPTAVLGALTMTSMANAGLLAATRIPFAMARDDLAPRFLGLLHRRYLTPTGSILFAGGTMALVITSLDVERIAKLASSFIILTYVAINVTVIVLRESGVQWYRPGYRSPLYPGIQVAGVAWGLVLLVVMGGFAVAACGAIALPGAVLYGVYGRRRNTRLGVVAQRGPRRDLLLEHDAKGQAKAGPQQEPEAQPAQGGGPLPKAEVLVPLFGTEKSAEVLVEVAAALSDGGAIDVVHLTHVPEQTDLDAIIHDAPRISSLRRRIGAMAESRDQLIRFDALASRDVVRTVHKLSVRVACRWLVVEWGGRASGTFTVRNPLGWLKDHVSCNLAIFHDAGVRTIRKILVAVEPGSHDSLIASTADHLAKVHGATLTFVRFVHDDAPRTQATCDADYLDQVRQLCEAPSDILLVRGKNAATAIGQTSAAYDLLVTAERPQGVVLRRVRGTGSDRLTETAACSVLRVQSPRQSPHTVIDRTTAAAKPPPPLMSWVEPRCVGAQLGRMNKEALFHHFAQAFAACLPEPADPQAVEDALWQREHGQNTAVGMGLALPHATLPAAGRTILGIYTTVEPLPYDAPDGAGADVFFVTIGTPSDRQAHLMLLASISRLILQGPMLDDLRQAQSTDDIMATLRRCESSAEKSRPRGR